MTTYVIGDVQGCYASLEKLLIHINFQPEQDKLIFAGDIVNRGPKSLATLRMIKHLGNRAECVLGNHDLYLLMCACGARAVRDKDTFNDILMAEDAKELLLWLAWRPIITQAEGFTIVHAGLLPEWSIDQALTLGEDFCQALREHWQENNLDITQQFFTDLWHDQPSAWRSDFSPYERWRVTINGMTRLRLLDHNHCMNFQAKSGLDKIPSHLHPWFSIANRKSRGSQLVCGHWSSIGLMLTDDVSHIDTGCAWGRHLTALRLPDRVVFQVPSQEHQ